MPVELCAAAICLVTGRLAEKFDRGECREERHRDGAHSDCQIAHGKVDLGFKTGDLGMNQVFEAGNIRFRRHALAQRVLHRLGMGASLIVLDAGALEPVDIGKPVE
jgi:hypothetical protein